MMTLDECIAAARLPISMRYIDGADKWIVQRRSGRDKWDWALSTIDSAKMRYMCLKDALLPRQRLSEQQGEKR